MTALVIGVPLDVLQVSPAWWGVFALGGVLLAGVLLSEYISVDPADNRSVLAIISLTAVSLGLFLTLVIALRGSGQRLYLILAAIAPASFLVAARCLQLRTGCDTWKPVWALGIAIVIPRLLQDYIIFRFFHPVWAYSCWELYLLSSPWQAILRVAISLRLWMEPALLGPFFFCHLFHNKQFVSFGVIWGSFSVFTRRILMVLMVAALVLVSYLIGSIPVGVFIVRIFTGKDVRQMGSGRSGGTNAMRAAGFVAGMLTAAFDARKRYPRWLPGRTTRPWQHLGESHFVDPCGPRANLFHLPHRKN